MLISLFLHGFEVGKKYVQKGKNLFLINQNIEFLPKVSVDM